VTAKTRRLALAGLVALALVLRVAVVAETGGYEPQWDARDYDVHALSLVHEGTYPTTTFAGLREADIVTTSVGLPVVKKRADGPSAFRPPTWPYLLAAVYRVSGDSWTAGRLTNALLGALLVPLSFLLGRRLWDEATGLVAAGIAAVAPPLAYMSAALMSEPLFLVLELAALLAVLRYRDERRLRWALAAGVLCGLCALTRANGVMVVVACMVGVAALGRAERGRALGAAAALAGAAALTIAPWTIRNAFALHELVPISTQAGFAIAGSYNEPARAGGLAAGWLHPLAVPELRREVLTAPGLNEADAERELRWRGTRFALDHPGYALGTTWWNSLRMFELADLGRYRDVFYAERGLSGPDRDVTRIGALVLAGLALAGLAVLLALPPRRRGPLFVWLTPVLLFASTVPINGSPRYRSVVDPYLVMLAALALVAGARRLRAPAGRRTSRTYSSRSVSDSGSPPGTTRAAAPAAVPSTPWRSRAPASQ
jgi:hypothetical protein